MDELNIEQQERKSANVARSALKASVINQIKRTFHRRSGKMEKSNVTTRFKTERLDRIILNMPRYSFQEHFGSSLTGTQKAHRRSGGNVKSFNRTINGKTQKVSAFNRQGSTVKAFRKNEPYRAKNHISRALNQTNALEVLATSLGENRIVAITSQIKF